MSPTPENQQEREETEKESNKESDVQSLSGESDRDRLDNGDNSQDQISAIESLPSQVSEHIEGEQKPALEGAESARSSGDTEVVDIEEQGQEMIFATAGRPEDSEVLDNAEHSPQAQGTDAGDLTTHIPPDSIDVSEGDSENPPATQIEPAKLDEIVAPVRPEGDSKKDVSLSEVPKPKRVTIDQYPIAQCQRLYGCIQAAASRLEDATNLKMKDRSTQRVSRLTKLIPRDPVEHIGN